MQYRVVWSASSNISFRGEGEWYDAEEGETAEEVEDNLTKGSGGIGDGLELVISETGLEWWVETRESDPS